MKKYYYAGGGRVAMRVGSGTGTTGLSWLLTDHLGSTAITASSSGAKSAELRYKAWGEQRYAEGVAPTDFRYTGQRFESLLGLHDYGARWYDSLLGRWIQPDSIVPLESQGVQAWDRYAYSYCNPVKYIDPDGHDPIPYDEFIKQAVNFFQNIGYDVIGNPLAKSINSNGADLVAKTKESLTVIAVELKNVASVDLGTLGKNRVGYYGGSLQQVLRSASRFINSSNEQLRLESKTII
jgi:RHS repeat-associated protein